MITQCRTGESGASHFHPRWGVARQVLFSLFFLVFMSGTLCAQSFSISVPDSLFSAPDTASFGLTRITRCDTLRLPLANTGTDPIILDSIRFLEGASSLSLIDEMRGTLIPSRERREIRLSFCPTDTFCVAARLVAYVRLTGGKVVTHTIGIGGCGGTSIISVDTDTIQFGSLFLPACKEDRFILTNSGNFPLRVISITVGSSPFRIVDPTRFPFTIPPHSIREVRVEFCPPDVGSFVDSVHILADADNPIPPLYLLGKADTRKLLLPALLDVGSVYLGACIDTFLVVKNNGTMPVTVNAVSLADLSLPSGFLLTSQFPADWTRTLFPNDTLHVPVRFCPTRKGEGHDSLSLTDGDQFTYRVAMRGRGVPPSMWLDTVSAEAGDIATLTFKIGPNDVVGPGLYRVRLSFNPDALSPVSVASAGDAGPVGIDYSGKGSVRVSGERFGVLSADGALFRIAFRGLSSGEPINIVEIEEGEFSGHVSEWDTLAGMVRLSGCDVGRLPGTGKRAYIQTVGPNPATDNVVLTYQAPLGRQPVLTLFDARGSQVQRIELPEGTDSPQEFHLDVVALPRGLYTVELQEREERSWKILLID